MAKNYRLYWRRRIILYDLANVLVIYVIVLADGYSATLSTIPVPVYLSLAILMHCRNSVLSWVTDQQKSQRHKQQAMGANSKVYLAAWMGYFYANGVVVVTLFSLLLYGGRFYGQWLIGVGQLVGVYVLFMGASVNFCLLLSTFFSDANLACQSITLVHIICSFFFNILNLNYYGHNSVVFAFASIFPPICFEEVLASNSRDYSNI